jgi:hypothetical protein
MQEAWNSGLPYTEDVNNQSTLDEFLHGKKTRIIYQDGTEEIVSNFRGFDSNGKPVTLTTGVAPSPAMKTKVVYDANRGKQLYQQG